MDFSFLPTNSRRIYTKCVDKSGCEIFVPAFSPEHAQQLKSCLQAFLDRQPPPGPQRPSPPPRCPKAA